MRKKPQAEFIQWMAHILDALRQHGGSATPREVYDTVARLAKVPDDKRFAKLDGGSLRYPNQVAWARQYLVWEGYLASPKRGLWMLTPTGQTKTLSSDDARKIFQKWVAIHAARRQAANPTKLNESPVPDAEPALDSYKEEVLSRLQSIPPEEFERFCADLHLQLWSQFQIRKYPKYLTDAGREKMREKNEAGRQASTGSRALARFAVFFGFQV